VKVGVDTRSGLLASRATPRRFVEVRTFVDLGPQYAAWSAAAGLPRPPGLVVSAVRREASPVALPPDAPPLLAGTTARVRITSPPNGLHVLRDPETPSRNATLALKAVVSPAVREVVWWVDGAPFAVAPYPYSVRWRVAPGEHSFVARLPFAPLASQRVTVRVE
jgi:penicillin-binding protein 1C